MLRAVLKAAAASSESSCLQNSSCTATYLPSRELSRKVNKTYLTAGEVKANSQETFSNGLLNMDIPAKNYIYKVYGDTGCHLEYLPSAMADRQW